MSTSSKTTPAPEPPAQAVALDAHWAAKQAKLNARGNATAVLRVCDDDGLKAALEEAKRTRRLAAAALEVQDADDKAAAKKHLTDAEKALAAAQAAVDAETVLLTFRALPRKAFDALVKAHPPTEEQAEDGDAWNIETFPPALVSAASVDGMPIEDAAEYLENWGPAEAAALFNAAYSVQQTNRMDLGKG